MDIFGDHYLLCRREPSSAGFQPRHRLVQQLLRQAGITHAVEPQHLRPSRDEGPESGRGSGLTRLADILLYGWRGDRHCCVDLVGVSPARGGWRDAASALASVEQAKRDKHTQTCPCHCFDFVPFGFSVFAPFSLHPRSSLTAYADDTAFTLALMIGKPMLGSIVVSLMKSCVGWLTSSSAAA